MLPFPIRFIPCSDGTSAFLTLFDVAVLTADPGNTLRLDTQKARNLAAHLEEAADAMEAAAPSPESEAT